MITTLLVQNEIDMIINFHCDDKTLGTKRQKIRIKRICRIRKGFFLVYSKPFFPSYSFVSCLLNNRFLLY